MKLIPATTNSYFEKRENTMTDILKSLLITIMTVSIVSACSFRVSTENNQTAANPAKVEENTKAIKKSALSDSDSFALSQTGGKTGTYGYKDSGIVNEISVQEIEGNKLRVKLYASYEYKINGNLNVNVGEASGVVTLDGNAAVLVPEDTENCEITLKFSGSKIIVKEKNESNCGFGLNVTASGTYAKTGGKPNFDDSDGDSNDDSTSMQNLNAGRISFARGKSSATISGSILEDSEKTYLVGARAGQTITIKITDGGGNNDVIFHLVAPDGSFPMGMAGEMPEFDTNWSGKLPKTGDYKIVLGTIEPAKANFKMSVSIR